MTWTSFHHRGEILRTVIEVADQRRDGRLPMDVEGVVESFDGELDLLCALQLRWHTRLAGRIEHELMSQPLDLEAAVVTAWHHAADAMPGVRAILDRHRAEPRDDAMARAMATSVAKERALLAVMAGCAAVDDRRAAAVGARIEERARESYRPGRAQQRASSTATDARPTLLNRIRAALAA
jgi:hypothetical protein